MNLVERYEELSKVVIKENKEIQEYDEQLKEQISSLSNFKLNKTMLTILIHPIRTIKNSNDLKRLISVKEEFDRMLNRSIVTYIDEETGVLEEDLEFSAMRTKPKMLKLYMKKNPINPKKSNKK